MDSVYKLPEITHDYSSYTLKPDKLSSVVNVYNQEEKGKGMEPKFID